MITISLTRVIRARWVVLGCVLVGCLLILGCDRAEDGKKSRSTTRSGGDFGEVRDTVGGAGESENSKNSGESGGEGGGKRIVSLAPALTQMIVEMGYADTLVGVAEHDLAAADDVPVVGNYRAVDLEALLTLQPTHVLTMIGRGQTPPSLTRLAEQRRFELVVYQSPLTVSQVIDILYPTPAPGSPAPGTPFPHDRGSDPTPSLAVVLGDLPRGRMIATRMNDQLTGLRELTANASGPSKQPPRVLLVIDTNPVLVSGPGTVHDQLLRGVGGVNAVGGVSGSQAPILDREMLLEARPDVILLLLPGAPPLQSFEKDSRLAGFRGLDIPGVVDRRIVLLNDPLILLPSSCVTRIAAAMGRGIYPELVGEIDRLMREDPDHEALPEDSLSTGSTPRDPDRKVR